MSTDNGNTSGPTTPPERSGPRLTPDAAPAEPVRATSAPQGAPGGTSAPGSAPAPESPPTPAPEPGAAAPASPATASEPGGAASRTPQKPATTDPASAEAKAKPEKELTPEQRLSQRRKRGALASGALSMPIITLGAAMMDVPLGIWYVSTVFKTVIVVITNMVTGRAEADAVNGALNNVDPGAMSSISISLIIIGGVLVLAALAISYFMLRAYDVEKPMRVTVFSVPMAAVIAAVVTASVGALGGLIFRDATHTVAGILGNAALGIAGFALSAIAVSIVIGAAVWWWVARIFRSDDVQPKR